MMNLRVMNLQMSDLKKSYPFECVLCGHGQPARPSLFMENGILNNGSGRCLGCGVVLHLWISGDVMVSQRYDDYLELLANESSPTGLRE